jgi:hypothetical protein
MQIHAQGVLIDRIAIVVGQSIIKDSDIDREVRLTEFLNHDPLQVGPAQRKKAAAQLVDQVFLREEIRAGSYPYATQQESTRQLENLVSQRFHTQAEFDHELKRYGLDEATLQAHFRWQLTVLSFVDERFKPAVVASDSAVDSYYRQHMAALRKAHPKDSLEQLHSAAREILTEQEVNRLFFAWLDDHRKSAKINFHEDGLA